MSLAHLPPELYSDILLQLPEDERQAGTLALTRALPNAPIPTYHMFTRIHLRQPHRIVQLYHRLRRSKDDAKYVEELTLEAWNADGAVMVNLLNLLKHLSSLVIYVGPDVTPELLHDAFNEPRPTLQTLSLKFRPYVKRVNYYQFLRGTYFDSFMEALSTWPKGRLRNLSLIQDLPRDYNALGFAQPLVFFSFKPLVALSTSSYTANLTRLTIRIPSRDIVTYIAAQPDAFRSVEVIDVSTCSISVPQIRTLLARFPKLRHIIADDSKAFVRIEAMTLWHALGRAFAFAAAERADEMEHTYKAQAMLLTTQENAGPVQADVPRRARPGRRGVATATISLRERPATRVSSPIPAQPPATIARSSVTRIKVLPVLPTLVSLSIDAYTGPNMDEFAVFQKQFQVGWEEGINMLRATWKRMQTSQMRSTTRIMVPRDCKFLADRPFPDGADGSPFLPISSGFDWEGLLAMEWSCPILCCAGEREERELHAKDCGHFV